MIYFFDFFSIYAFILFQKIAHTKKRLWIEFIQCSTNECSEILKIFYKCRTAREI